MNNSLYFPNKDMYFNMTYRNRLFIEHAFIHDGPRILTFIIDHLSTSNTTVPPSATITQPHLHSKYSPQPFYKPSIQSMLLSQPAQLRDLPHHMRQGPPTYLSQKDLKKQFSFLNAGKSYL